MADYIEGKRPVIEALRAQMPMKCVMLADNLQQDGQVKDILRKARQFNVPVKTVTRRKLDDMSERGSHQGVMAQALPYPYSSFKEILRGAEKHAEEHDGNALIVVLDHITDAGKPRSHRSVGRGRRRVGRRHPEQAQRPCYGGYV